MSESGYTVLLADPDLRVRTLLANQLEQTGCTVLQTSDGESALRLVNDLEIRLVVAEMYLRTGEDDCLIHAIRRSKDLRKTRTLAHTSHATSADREWAMRAGADAYLIKPTRAERFRYVVSRLATTKGANSSVPVTSHSAIVRRDSLEHALADVESGELRRASAIVFSRTWWQDLPRAQHNGFAKRAKQAGVKLRSDSMLGGHFVEVRGTPDESLSTERPEGPYRNEA